MDAGWLTYKATILVLKSDNNFSNLEASLLYGVGYLQIFEGGSDHLRWWTVEGGLDPSFTAL